MEKAMHSHGFMGYPQWSELALFGVLAVISLVLLTQCRRLRHGKTSTPTMTAPPHTPRRKWSYILYGLVHCTLGDLFILLVT